MTCRFAGLLPAAAELSGCQQSDSDSQVSSGLSAADWLGRAYIGLSLAAAGRSAGLLLVLATAQGGSYACLGYHTGRE